MHVATQPADTLGAPRIRVMIVDDSAVVRALLTRWVVAEPGFDVVGSAPNGREALDLVDACRPDIVLLDLEMPVMDGVEALPLLLQRRPGLFVIVVSTLTTRNAAIALRCLSRGAFDYLTKPGAKAQAEDAEGFHRLFRQKLQGLSAEFRRRSSGRLSRPASGTRAAPMALRPTGRPAAILIGASTGGPQAATRLLSHLPKPDDAPPILVVQHMPPVVTEAFADHIREATALNAHEALDGEVLRPGRVYVAPGGRHMRLAAREGAATIRLDDGPPVHFCRPAVDLLFADAAVLFGGSVLAIVLTGMGHDGTAGAGDIVGAGGTVLAQDEATSVVWGMPGSVAKSGFAQRVLPLDGLAVAMARAIEGGAP